MSRHVTREEGREAMLSCLVRLSTDMLEPCTECRPRIEGFFRSLYSCYTYKQLHEAASRAWVMVGTESEKEI